MKILKFEPEEKLDQYIDVKSDSKSDSDSPEVSKSYLDPLNDPYWPLMDHKTKIFIFEQEENLDQLLDILRQIWWQSRIPKTISGPPKLPLRYLQVKYPEGK